MEKNYNQELEIRKAKVISRRKEDAKRGEFTNKNNKVLLRGYLQNEFQYGYSTEFEDIYFSKINVQREGERIHRIPIVVSGVLIEKKLKTQNKGKRIEVMGRIKSYNDDMLRIYILVQGIRFINDEKVDKSKDPNNVYIDGYISKMPNFRTTPSGKRITDIFLAVKEEKQKANYIPCIAWEDDAEEAQYLKIGDRISIRGEIQARTYQKKYSDDTEYVKKITVYEVSAKEIKKLGNKK